MKEMKHIRIKNMRDLQLAKELYRYETNVYNQALSTGIYRFRRSFKSSLENTLRVALQNALIFGITKLISKK